MSVNASSNSLPSSLYLLNKCFDSKTTVFIYASFVGTNIFLLCPLFILVLHLGLRQWKKQRSRSAPETMNNSDFFTFNVIALELISMLGSSIYCAAAFTKDKTLESIGSFICSVTSPGQTLFHLLTSVERYLAVVHPITYLDWRRKYGVRIRDTSTAFVWLLSLGWMCLPMAFGGSFGSITVSILLVFSLIVVSFSGLFILCVLKSPGPGQVSGAQGRVDHVKRRAFHTIVAIMVALLLRFVGVLVCNITFTPPDLTPFTCAVGSSAIWLTLPCSLVLPLLFLQRAGKLPGCKCDAKSG